MPFPTISRGGNCCSHKATVNIDEGLCAQYIERGEAQAKLAQVAFAKVGGRGIGE